MTETLPGPPDTRGAYTYTRARLFRWKVWVCLGGPVWIRTTARLRRRIPRVAARALAATPNRVNRRQIEALERRVRRLDSEP